ncbi:ATPase [Velocimicrobium porci]|uniref:ATPase n=1 Tax=Velocimicrobium porci TaxID=2606634 RepID=A0A6L5XYJ6_9FIRM|nr:ATPase [Velocimicrobium porci]MSS63298.1 ATPase [Velocimicrobium porci]
MGMSRIEQSIEDIYEFIENCKMQPLSSTKVVVPKDELYDLLDELRMRTPDEIKRYKKVIANREAILADAEKKVQQMIEDAKKQTDSLINNSEIMQKAYEQANDVVSKATEEANRILSEANQEADQVRLNALEYTNDLLKVAEASLRDAYQMSSKKFQELNSCLKQNLDVVVANRAELGVDSMNANQNASSEEQVDALVNQMEQKKQNNEDYNFDEDTFINNIP